MRVGAPVSVRPFAPSFPTRSAVSTAVFAGIAVISVVVATRVQAPSLGLALGVSAGVALTVWMFFSENMDRPMVVLLLYLGLLDGFLKLRTNSTAVTLVRDVLLYAILVGFVARAALRRQELRPPPMTGWILAFVIVVIVQLANPADEGLTHSLASLRPHLEFVPLFFVGYALLQSRKRLRTFFVILLVIATANGVVGMIQLNLTPTQLSSWGPGYAFRINNEGTGLDAVSGRTFNTSTGAARTRPFGLGDDAGSGEAWGMLALGGALALMALGIRKSSGRLSLLLCVGPPLAIISGEGRGLLIGSLAALFAYVCFATTPKRLIPTLGGVILGLGAIVAVIAFVSSVSGSGVFDRYATITPNKVANTTSAERGSSLSYIPTQFVRYPLGNGLGTTGPASGFQGIRKATSNGESEPGFLLSELGIPGLIVVYGFMLTLLSLGIARIRRFDPEARVYIAALLAGFVGLLVAGVAGATTATAPAAPYTWFAGGVLAYWLTKGAQRGRGVVAHDEPALAVPAG